MNTFELWRLSKKVYMEMFFQSLFSLRVGGIMSQGRDAEKNIRELAKSTKMNAMFSKAIIAFLIGFSGVFTLSASSNIGGELAVVCGVSSTLGIILFMMVFVWLDIITSFVSSRVAELLTPLPLSTRDISKILMMCFIRIFDIPLIVAILVIPIAYGVSYGSVPGALTVLLGVAATEAFALAIAVFLAISFYSKVVRGGGGSTWKMLKRLFYMLIWSIPMFLMYAITSFMMQMVSLMENLAQSFPFLLTLLYPFSLGFLASSATFLNIDDPMAIVLSVGSSLVYFALAARSFKWLVGRVVGIGFGGVATISRMEVRDIFINPGAPWLGVIKKDLRIASRSPYYFSNLIIPIIVICSFSSFLPFLSPDVGVSVEFSLLTLLPLPLMSLIMLIPPFVLLSMEGLAYSYVGSLPLTRRTLILAKTIISSAIYLISLLTLLLVTVLVAPDLIYTFALFGGIYTFSVIASIIIEILLLLRFFGQAIPSGNLYFRLYAYILPLILGSIVMIIPTLVCFVTLLLTGSSVLSIAGLTAISILELLIALLLLVRRKQGISESKHAWRFM